MGTPLELIQYNSQTGKFVPGKSALDVLRKVKGPVAVVAVCGRARQGKSFILNQLLQSSGGGFQVGPTHRPCTKGLWMWSTPQPVTSSDGSTHHLVLLDTEGIEAWDQTGQYSTQIFSLAVLLSSLFVYNQMGGIDESSLDKLGLVTELAKRVRVRAAAAQGSGGDEEGLGEHSPAFLWLLRDFYLQLEEDGRKITPKEYLETALRPMPGNTQSIASKNAIRESIMQLFPVRDCFSLVRPLLDEKELSQMDNLPKEKLRPEFRQGVKDLLSLIFHRAHPKRFGTQLITGPVLAGLVGAYVGAINEGAVPTIATAWQGVAESECRRGCDAAEAVYTASWAEGGEVPPEEADLEARHQQCLNAARAAYADVAVGDEQIRKAHEARWTAAVTSRYKDLRARRLAEAASAVNELLYKGANDIAQMARGGADIGAIQQRLGAFLTHYEKTAAGPTKWHKLSAFLQETWPAVAMQVLDRQAAAAKAAFEAVQREVADLRNQVSSERQRAEQAERLHRDATSNAKALQQQLGDVQQEVIRLGAALEQRSAAGAALQQQLNESQQECARTRAALEQKSGDAASLQQQLALAQQEGARLRVALEQKSGMATTLQQQLAEETSRLQSALEGKSSEAASLQRRLGEMEQQATSLRAALEQKTNMVSTLEAQMQEVLLVSERKQASAGELAEARIREAQEAHLSKVAEVAASLTAERARAGSLAADLQSLRERYTSAENKLLNQETEAADWRAKYMRESTSRLELQHELDKAVHGMELRTVERDSVARELDAARALLEQLQADLQATKDAKDATQARLEAFEAEAQAARAGTLGLGAGAGPSNYGNDENMDPVGGADAAAGAAAGGGNGGAGGVLVDASNASNMTIQEIKSTLTAAGFAEEVWTLAARKPAPKKSDWVDLMQRKANP